MAIETNCAATDIQRIFRGYQARKKIVLPRELREALPRFSAEDCLLFAREIRDLTIHRGDFGEYGKRVTRDEVHRLPAFDGVRYQGVVEASLPCTTWIRSCAEGRQIEVEFVGQMLASRGDSKKIFGSQLLSIHLKPNHPMHIEDAVLIDLERDAEAADVRRVRDLLREKFDDEELKDLYKGLGGVWTYLDRQCEGRIHARDIRLEKDMLFCEDLNLETRAHVLGDVASTLTLLHEKGLVHNDVHPGNIMVSRDGHSGYLIDLETLGSWCTGGNPFTYDALAREGILTPFRDIYSFAETCSIVLFDLKWLPWIDYFDHEMLFTKLEEMVGAEMELNSFRYKALKRMIENLRDLKKENKQTVAFYKENRHLDLREDPSPLYEAFPAFAKFLSTMESVQIGFVFS